MRSSDGSSDVCSSVLEGIDVVGVAVDDRLQLARVVDLALEAERLQQEAQGLAVREEVLDGLDLADRLLEGADVALDVLAAGEGRARGDLVLLIALEGGEGSEEHTSELQSLMRHQYGVFYYKK